MPSLFFVMKSPAGAGEGGGVIKAGREHTQKKTPENRKTKQNKEDFITQGEKKNMCAFKRI